MAMVQLPLEPRLTSYLSAKAASRNIPISGTFELTPVCNMACRMCYVRMTAQEQQAIAPLKTPEQWLELAKTARDKGMLYLLLTGGEPFLLPWLPELLAGLQTLGLIVSINSNGTLIDEKTIQWLKKSPPARVNVTLYGASDETYALLCGNPNGFTQAVRGITLLRQAGITVKINCSLTPENAQDLEGIFRFAQENHLPVQATSYMFPPMRRDASMVGKNHRFTPEEAAYHAARIECGLLGQEEWLRRVERESAAALPADGEDCSVTEGQGEGIRCRAGKSSFWVTWEGKMLPCGMIPMAEAKNVFTEGFTEAWEQASSHARGIRLPAACAVCKEKDHCKACAAMVYTESGDYQTVPQYRCRMNGAYPRARQRLYHEIMKKTPGGTL